MKYQNENSIERMDSDVMDRVKEQNELSSDAALGRRWRTGASTISAWRKGFTPSTDSIYDILETEGGRILWTKKDVEEALAASYPCIGHANAATGEFVAVADSQTEPMDPVHVVASSSPVYKVGHSGVVLIRVSGCSMEPHVVDGGFVMARPVSDPSRVPDGTPVVILEGDYAYIKRITRRNGGSVVVGTPIGNTGETLTWKAKDISITHVVVGSMGVIV